MPSLCHIFLTRRLRNVLAPCIIDGLPLHGDPKSSFSNFSMASLARAHLSPSFRKYASLASDKSKYKVVVVGGGSAGLSVANQIYNRFKAAGKPLNQHDIAILDANDWHFYQPGWTLVGSGLKKREDTRRSLGSLIPKHITRIPENVRTFSPKSSSVTTTHGRTIAYDALVVAPGLQINWDRIPGLSEALFDTSSGVSSIYSYETASKVWADIESLREGNAVFTQPTGVIKCAGAPQKIMWMAWDRFQKTGRKGIRVDFYTGMPTMFAVKKYSEALNALREERKTPKNHQATFKKADDSIVEVGYTTLHVSPPMGPLKFIKESPIANKDGWVDVNKATLRHNNPEFGNIFAIGDASSLPTSKTIAAITAQAPVLTENLYSVLETGDIALATYDGYTSCPVLTGYGELMLAEFQYGLEPEESFETFFGDQSKPRRAFYHLKKDCLSFCVRGRWFGKNALTRPDFS
ncbi:FAD/NAD(P)-binding domain-containing protein [Flagelloscypha sp. PMI_526]|nr:FAD/NAD(P)-binding domain-containing protein [Flagelloscypha sp. PMI_526]